MWGLHPFLNIDLLQTLRLNALKGRHFTLVVIAVKVVLEPDKQSHFLLQFLGVLLEVVDGLHLLAELVLNHILHSEVVSSQRYLSVVIEVNTHAPIGQDVS